MKATLSMGDYVVDCLAEGCGWHVEGSIVRVLKADALEHARDTGHREDIAVVRSGTFRFEGA